MVKVNPPPHVPIPLSIKKDPALLSYFQANERIMFQMYNRIGGPVDAVSDSEAASTSSNAAQFNALNARLGSGDILTIDTSGFTIDTSKQFTDQEQA